MGSMIVFGALIVVLVIFYLLVRPKGPSATKQVKDSDAVRRGPVDAFRSMNWFGGTDDQPR